MKTIGILALQGDFLEHLKSVEESGAQGKLVKTNSDLKNIDALILPGGESTSMGIIAEKNKLVEPIKNFIKTKKPVWGTCAGIIMLSEEITNQKRHGQVNFGGLNIKIERNYFGRQINSFEKEITINTPEKIIQKAVFIRAPGIVEYGKNVEILANIDHGDKQIPVAVRQDNILGTTFHTELSNNSELLKYFISF